MAAGVKRPGPLGPGGASPTPLCQHNLTLEVKDGKVAASDTMVLTLENSAPNAVPSGEGTYQVNTQVSLGGQVSDFDGDPLTYKWREGAAELNSGAVTGIQGGEPINLTPFLISNLPVGDHDLTLEVLDGTNPPVSQSVTVRIIDDHRPHPGADGGQDHPVAAQQKDGAHHHLGQCRRQQRPAGDLEGHGLL